MTPSNDNDPENALDHPRRELIHEELGRRPGMNWNQLQKATGLSVGALLFHLRKLEEAEAVVRKPSTNENEVLFFTPDNAHLYDDPSTRVLFGNESTREVAHAVVDNPGRSAQDLAEELDIHPMTVRYHMDKLVDTDLIRKERDGRTIHYHPVDKLQHWFEQFGSNKS